MKFLLIISLITILVSSGRGLTEDEQFDELIREIDKVVLFLKARIAASENNVTDVLEKYTGLLDHPTSSQPPIPVNRGSTASQPPEPEVRNTGSEPAKAVDQGFTRPKNSYDLPFDVINRCYMLSRTLPDEERSNYLITLQRKISESRHQYTDLNKLNLRLASNIHFRKWIFITFGVLNFFGSLVIFNHYFIHIIT
ncbi:uncharacterized protein LOC111027005 [Myzus persicae]|uniref:uncharacterized protein LOC111027005 n=1 Tax=Myzus persicae TaxID=13164 RepID=UPI000B9336E5|nr:uncharacterized protein LOC111027005 [Myzus persicae]